MVASILKSCRALLAHFTSLGASFMECGGRAKRRHRFRLYGGAWNFRGGGNHVAPKRRRARVPSCRRTPYQTAPGGRKPKKTKCARALLACVLGTGAAALGLAGCGKGDSPVVVIYTSQDEVFAEPILEEFEKQTGIQVRPVFDSEAVKTVGLVNRLLTERDQSAMRRVLEQRGVPHPPIGRARCFPRNQRLDPPGLPHPPHGHQHQLLSRPPRPARLQRRHQSTLARQSGPGLPALRHHRHPFPRPAPALGRRRLAVLVPRPGGQQALSGGRQLGGRQTGRPRRGLDWLDRFRRHRRRATGGLPVWPCRSPKRRSFVPNTVGVIRNCPHPEAAERLYRVSFQSISLGNAGELPRAGRRDSRPGPAAPGFQWIGTNYCETSTP